MLDEADCTVDIERRSSALLETVEFSEFEVLLVAVSAKTDKKTSVTFPHRVGAASTRISLRSLHQVSHFVQHACTGVRAVQRIPRSCDREIAGSNLGRGYCTQGKLSLRPSGVG